MSNLEEFRKETRSWLEENCPQSMRTPTPEEEVIWGGRKQEWINPDSKIWMDRMAEKGWTFHGGRRVGGGLSADEDKVLMQEMSRIRARSPLQSFGIWMLGPALLEFASEEQKLHYLPQIARGEIRWCQGYSEPGSGSDLAGLQTKAEDQGDYYLLTAPRYGLHTRTRQIGFLLSSHRRRSGKHDSVSFLLSIWKARGDHIAD